jgi:hypothetical protein
MGNFPDIHVFSDMDVEGAIQAVPAIDFHATGQGIVFTGNIHGVHTLEVTDVAGSILYALPVASNTVLWKNGSPLLPGVYFLRLHVEGNSISKKFVVMGKSGK